MPILWLILGHKVHPTLPLSLTLTQTLHQFTARSQLMAGAFCVLKVSCGWVHRAFLAPHKCVCRCALQIGALNNSNPDPPTSADREVPNHDWPSLCDEDFLWMGSQGVLSSTAQIMRMQMRTANRGRHLRL